MHIRILVRAWPALLAGTLVACTSPKDASVVALPAVSVVTLTGRLHHRTVDLPGRTAAHLVAAVTPQVTGVIQKRLFIEGSEVRAGDVLYQVDPAPYQAALGSARAALARANASILSARPLAERDVELSGIDAISREELEAAQATLRQDEAMVLAAKADIDMARINLAYTRIKAPISGTVGASVLTEGALVTANQASTLTTIYAYDPIYVDVTQSSVEVLKLRQQLTAGTLRVDPAGCARIRITLEDGSVYPLEGRLQFTDVAVNEATGTITLRATVPNPEKLLMPGMYVHARIEEGVMRDALVVPQQAVSHDAMGNSTVFIIDRANKVQQRVVALGAAEEGGWLVENGLRSGDRVVVEGSQNIREGDVVATHVFAN